MTRPVTLVKNIILGLTADKCGFDNEDKPGLNFNADSYDFVNFNAYGLLDSPIHSGGKLAKTGVSIMDTPLEIFFVYPVELDDTQAMKDIKLQKGWDLAREFVLKLNATDDVVDITSFKYNDVDYLWDLNMCGCFLELTYKARDTQSNCIS